MLDDAAIGALLARGKERQAKRAAATHALSVTPEERRALRLAAGLTLCDVGATIGVTDCTVGNWERGDKPLRGANAKAYVEIIEALVEAQDASGL